MTRAKKRVVSAIALAGTVALLFAGPLSAQPLPQLSFAYVIGQTFHYHIAGASTSTFGSRESVEGDYTVEITGHDAKGWHAVERLSSKAMKRVTTFTISENGVWTKDSDGSTLPNYISFDPSTMCPPSASTVKVGDTWSCDVPGDYVRRSGSEKIVVVKLTDDGITLDISGATATQHHNQLDPTSGTNIQFSTRETWHDVVTFEHGRQVRIVSEETHGISVPGSSKSGKTTVTNTLTSE